MRERWRDPSRPSKFQFKLYSVCNFWGVTYVPIILSLRLRDDYCILSSLMSDLGVTLWGGSGVTRSSHLMYKCVDMIVGDFDIVINSRVSFFFVKVSALVFDPARWWWHVNENVNILQVNSYVWEATFVKGRCSSRTRWREMKESIGWAHPQTSCALQLHQGSLSSDCRVQVTLAHDIMWISLA